MTVNRISTDNYAVCAVSSWGVHCHQAGCPEVLEIKRTTSGSPSHEDAYDALIPALETAAVFLGWRVYCSVYWCPTHTVIKKLACSSCRMACPRCTCVGGPRGVAVFGGLPSLIQENGGTGSSEH